ncbi:lytic transglycosylase domain-containing protein [Haliea sp. E1-2-M8]|uniref:lytic transglycosylase domain-containing protein n=1 Tax=Haliea sp. E1-2-M8 TaxID=3064706 RepID=UPI0027226338|nr:lytic transglycosylase domain-containing protein [Haliea sp. E1-2-M8]MDO8863273.1 lytic transglycosylase domain-containing protein [Haliea sp. E1-2-M8]
MGARTVMMTLLVSYSASVVAAEREVYELVSRYVGVPNDVLYAMAQAESGRAVAGRIEPWPWTLNIEGNGHYFDDREAMFDAMMTALRGDKLSVDVGPMQLNWSWQFDRLQSPWRITDPVINIKVAAEVLRDHYERSGDWRIAVGHYHRPSEASAKHRLIAEKYRQRVWSFLDEDSAFKPLIRELAHVD